MSDERRVHSRYPIWFPVTLDTGAGEVWGVCRDASQKGLFVSTVAPLTVGAEVTVAFRVTANDGSDRRVRGRVVRVETGGEANPRAVWPYRIAVEFEEPMEEIEQPLRRHSTRPPPRA